MLYRQAKILSNYILPNTGTYVFDLNVVDPISQLWLRFAATNGATDNNAVTMPQVVSRIEILDGSEIIYALTGQEAYGLSCAWLQRMPFITANERGGAGQECSFLIPFGRYLGDPSYAFNAARFTNPQCRVTFDLTAVRACGVLGFATGTLTVTVLADILETGASPLGYVMSKTNYAFVSAAGGITYIDLPTDYPYLGFLLRIQAAGVWMGANISNVKLQCDQNKYIPFDLGLSDFMRYPRWQNPRYRYEHQFHLADGELQVNVLKMDDFAVCDVLVNLATEAHYMSVGVGQAPLRAFVGGAADPVARNQNSKIAGYCPYGTIWVPLGQKLDPSDWFQSRSYNSMRLELSNGAAGAACSVCTVQEHPY